MSCCVLLAACLAKKKLEFEEKGSQNTIPIVHMFSKLSSSPFFLSNNGRLTSGRNGEGRDLLVKINGRNKLLLYWCRVAALRNGKLPRRGCGR